MAPMEDVKEELVQATVPVQAAMGPAVTQAWQPMHTAPKDGTKIDLLFPYPRGRTINCYWAEEPFHCWVWRTPKWCGADNEHFDQKTWGLLPESEWPTNCYPNMEPTHWMPPPEPPESSLTADPVPETAGGSLEPNLPSLLHQVSVLKEALKKHARQCELLASAMRDDNRTGGWKGAETVAQAFDRQARAARTALSAPDGVK